MANLIRCRACDVERTPDAPSPAAPYLSALTDVLIWSLEEVRAVMCPYHADKLDLMLAVGQDIKRSLTPAGA